MFLLFQFERYEPEDGKIAERDLGQYLLVYADMPKARRNKMLKRVKKKFSDDEEVGGENYCICCNGVSVAND